ncbi:MAG: sulfatase, partial [Planctomycetes bacterium]|nr:sulfatase [Planctomycetota bacterium]
WHYPLAKAHFLGGRSTGAIRQGDWKLIEFFDTGEVELYNLADDIGESNNLAGAKTDKVKELRQALAAWRKAVGAVIPPDCRDYDPKQKR